MHTGQRDTSKTLPGRIIVLLTNGMYRFYYADERKADGAAKYKVSGPAHGEYYLSLAKGEKQGPWLATFVDGEGYKDFGETSD